MSRIRVLPLLAACVLLHPLAVSAADRGEEITLTPPAQMPSAVGTVSVQCSRNMNGTVIEVYREQPEGSFLYYTQRITLCDGMTVHFPLWEGDYRMMLSCVDGESAERRERKITFTIDDPDMDPEQSFDTTHLTYFLDTDAAAAQDSSSGTEKLIENREITAEYDYHFARADFALGDLNADGEVNASDAAEILIAAAAVGAGSDAGLTSLQMEEADLNGDLIFNSSDAAGVLTYSAMHAAGDYTEDVLHFVREYAENATNMTENAG